MFFKSLKYKSIEIAMLYLEEIAAITGSQWVRYLDSAHFKMVF